MTSPLPPAAPPAAPPADISGPGDEPAAPPVAPFLPPLLPARVRLLDLLLVLAATAALLLAAGMGLGVLAALLPPDPAVLGGVALVQSVLPLVVVAGGLVWWRGVPWATIGLRPAEGKWLRLALLLGVLTVPLAGLINVLVDAVVPVPFENPQIGILAPITGSPLAAVLIVITAVGVAPVVEEVIFRGLFYGWLRRFMGFVPGALLSGGAFAAVHGIAFLLPVLLIQGLILAWLYERSRSLWPSILLHATFNGVMMLGLFAAVRAGVVP